MASEGAKGQAKRFAAWSMIMRTTQRYGCRAPPRSVISKKAPQEATRLSVIRRGFRIARSCSYSRSDEGNGKSTILYTGGIAKSAGSGSSQRTFWIRAVYVSFGEENTINPINFRSAAYHS